MNVRQCSKIYVLAISHKVQWRCISIRPSLCHSMARCSLWQTAALFTKNKECSERLEEQDCRAQPRQAKKWIRRYLKRTIRVMYGHKCHCCHKYITMQYKPSEPVHREPENLDPALYPGSRWRHFHFTCWRAYQKSQEQSRKAPLQVEQDAPPATQSCRRRSTS